MSQLKKSLVALLEKIPGLEDRPSRVAGGSALFYRSKEIAHFHSANEIDVRLTKNLIKQERLHHPGDSKFHHRGPSSHWIELRFHRKEHLQEIVRLFKLALTSNNS